MGLGALPGAAGPAQPIQVVSGRATWYTGMAQCTDMAWLSAINY